MSEPSNMSLRPGHPGQAHVVLALLGGAGLVFFALPLIGLVSRATPAGLWRQLGSPAVQAALWLSLEVSLMPVGAQSIHAFKDLPAVLSSTATRMSCRAPKIKENYSRNGPRSTV